MIPLIRGPWSSQSPRDRKYSGGSRGLRKGRGDGASLFPRHRWLHTSVNAPNATDLYASDGREGPCYVSCVTTKQEDRALRSLPLCLHPGHHQLLGAGVTRGLLSLISANQAGLPRTGGPCCLHHGPGQAKGPVPAQCPPPQSKAQMSEFFLFINTHLFPSRPLC